jgi:hypothetical protein
MNPGIALLLVLLLLLPLPMAAQEVTATLLEGTLRVIRGTAVLQGVEGMRLRQGDILESAAPGFAQLEFSGGTIAALGPSSRVFLFKARTGGNGGEIVLLSGWLKGETGAKGGPFRYDTPLLGATTKDGTFVLHASSSGAEIFVESSSGDIAGLSQQGSWGRAVSAKAGQFFTRKPGKDVATSARPDAAFLDSMPRAFRDTFPSRLSRFAGKKVPEPKRGHEVTYAEIQPWLTMGQLWRRGFVERFQSRLKDIEFRQAIEDHLGDHPEWDPVLHPEKYQTKPSPAPANNSGAPHGGY